MTEDNDIMHGRDVISLKEYLRHEIETLMKLIDERGLQYNIQFKASEIAVNAALAAQEKAVTAAFLASEKAIVKAEDAQKDYNQRSNEFRGQLDDQAKTLMPRVETIGLFKNVDDRINALQVSIDSKMESARIANQKEFESTKVDIKSLRESRAGGIGRETQHAVNIAYLISAIGIIIGFMSFVVMFIR